jgi:isochorismate synthase
MTKNHGEDLERILKIDLYELLLQSTSDRKFFFQSQDKSLTVLALGVTEEISFHEAPSFLKINPELLLWSAMCFEKPDSSSFYASGITLIKKDGQTTALFNPRIDLDLQKTFQIKNKFSSNELKTIQLSPDFNQWQGMLKQALEMLQSNALSKVVLKRKKIINFTTDLDPLDVFSKTYSSNSESYNIFVQHRPHMAFISFSPEKLFSLTNNSIIQTISLAGSVPRGQTSIEDQAFEDELFNSPKLINEQNIVTNEISARLATLADDISIADLSVIKLRYIQHRFNSISAKLFDNKNFLDLITTLHPTPAVGGTPSPLALSTIAHLEQDVRNNYAAPIGFATNNYSEWAVGLRSASIADKTLTIFAGCGIVTGSVPEIEWAETENKMRPFAAISGSENSYV